jgi:hypothetical protein
MENLLCPINDPAMRPFQSGLQIGYRVGAGVSPL